MARECASKGMILGCCSCCMTLISLSASSAASPVAARTCEKRALQALGMYLAWDQNRSEGRSTQYRASVGKYNEEEADPLEGEYSSFHRETGHHLLHQKDEAVAPFRYLQPETL